VKKPKARVTRKQKKFTEQRGFKRGDRIQLTPEFLLESTRTPYTIEERRGRITLLYERTALIMWDTGDQHSAAYDNIEHVPVVERLAELGR